MDWEFYVKVPLMPQTFEKLTIKYTALLLFILCFKLYHTIPITL